MSASDKDLVRVSDPITMTLSSHSSSANGEVISVYVPICNSNDGYWLQTVPTATVSGAICVSATIPQSLLHRALSMTLRWIESVNICLGGRVEKREKEAIWAGYSLGNLGVTQFDEYHLNAQTHTHTQTPQCNTYTNIVIWYQPVSWKLPGVRPSLWRDG